MSDTQPDLSSYSLDDLATLAEAIDHRRWHLEMLGKGTKLAVALPGEVWVDGELAYAGLWPWLHEDMGLKLKRLREDNPERISRTGPHVTIHHVSSLLASITRDHVRDELRQGIGFELAAPLLGHVARHSTGARAGGTFHHRILKLQLRVTLQEALLKLQCSGSTGAAEPWSYDAKPAPRVAWLAPLSFRLWCDIPIALIPQVVFDRRQALRLQAALERDAAGQPG